MADNLSIEAQKVVDAHKQLYKLRYETSNYSDEELQKLMYAALEKGLATQSMARKYEYIGEKLACEAILEERKKKRTQSEKAIEEWPDIMHKLQNEAVLNLKTAITPNAQLIAAVLEEEGDLTEDELSGWCDELASLPDNEFKNILSGMEAEKVICRKEGKYHLLNICTPSLFPEDIKCFILERLSEDTASEGKKAIKFKIMDMIAAFGAQTSYSIPSEMKFYAKLSPDAVLNEENVKDHSLLNGRGKDIVIGEMVDNGLLSRYITSYDPVYYFPMLGLKEDE